MANNSSFSFDYSPIRSLTTIPFHWNILGFHSTAPSVFAWRLKNQEYIQGKRMLEGYWLAKLGSISFASTRSTFHRGRISWPVRNEKPHDSQSINLTLAPGEFFHCQFSFTWKSTLWKNDRGLSLWANLLTSFSVWWHPYFPPENSPQTEERSGNLCPLSWNFMKKFSTK